MLGVLAEVGRARPTFDDTAVDRLDHLYRHAADEVRAALAWSRRAADAETDFAEQVVFELPAVHAAFLVGEIDRPKVRVFAQHCCGLTAAQITVVCARLVPVAGRLTPGQLAVRLRRLIAGIDPTHYERRYRKALRDRAVCAWLDDSGAAVLSARGLTPAQAQAAVERIDLVAHAARRAGHRSTLDQIRVDVVAGLLDGSLHHLSREQIIAHLLANRSTNDDGAATAAKDDAGSAGDGGPAREGAPEDGALEGSAAAGNAAQDGAGKDSADEDRVAGDSADGYAAVPDGDHRVGVEVRVGLSTLLGHDQHPGEVAGLGPVPAGHAREIVARQRRAEWRYAITDRDGRLLFDGITRRRPLDLSFTGPAGGIVELHIRAESLPELVAETVGSLERTVAAWATVVADIARRYTDRDQHDRDRPDKPNRDEPDRDKPDKPDGAQRDGRPELDAHPDERLPRTALRRHVQIRDRTCVGPGCRRRSRRCDQDHTIAYQKGGKTVAADLGPLCRHDHVLKTDGGWALQQPEPGRFVWTTALTARHEVRPEPVQPPLPEPCPAPADAGHDEPPPAAPETLEVWTPTPKPPRPPPPQPPPSHPDEQPPF